MRIVRVENRLPKFKKELYLNLDTGFRELAKDILIESQNEAPFKRGQLRTDSDIDHVGLAHWRVRYHKEYARAQEFGTNGSVNFRNYTTAGTGKHYLSKTGDKVFSGAIISLKKHAGRTR